MRTIFSFFKKQEERFWMTVVIFGIAVLAVLLPQLYDSSSDTVSADGLIPARTTWTVCASGCDFITITDAFASSTVLSGHTINPLATYASSTETFPLEFQTKENIYIDCNLSGATIGTDSGAQVDIVMTNWSSVRQCNLSNVRIVNNGVSDVFFEYNTFATSTTGTIFFDNAGGSNNSISNNTGLNSILVGSGQQNFTITSNTIETYHPVTNTSTVYTSNIENFTFTSNTVRSYDSSVNNLLSVRTATTTHISGNTFEYSTSPLSSNPSGALYLADTVGSVVSYNTILLEQTDDANDGIYVYAQNTDRSTDVEITHNTIWMYNHSNGIHVSDPSGESSPGGLFTVTSTYNIFYNASSTANGVGVYLDQYSAFSTYAITTDYNGYYHLDESISGSALILGSLPSLGNNEVTTHPYFKQADGDTTNDTQLTPFSVYLDVNGTEDIGAHSGVRGSSFTLDDDCSIDYTTCHGTSTVAISENAVDGDTWNLAAGTYDALSLATTTLFTGLITIDGVGASTVIQPTTAVSGIDLSGIDGITIQDLIVQQASTAGLSGLRFFNTSNATIQNVTSTGNYYGISFIGNSGSNTISNSMVTSSAMYDIFSSSTLNNTLSNVSFLNTSSSISDVGEVAVEFHSRTYVQNGSATPLGGVTVTYYSAYYLELAESCTGGCILGPPPATLTTDASGYTSDSGSLFAYTLTSASVAKTNGGYNPFIIKATATSTYGETHIIDTTLDEQNELFTITMYDPPIAPTNFVTTTVASSSVAFSWTDNSADEDTFYIQKTRGIFPASGTSMSADATTGTVLGLTPNTEYMFRLTGKIGGSHSSYETVSGVYTRAAAPGTVTVTANSIQSVTVSWEANGNPDTTEYYVTNITNGDFSTWATSTSRTFTGLSAGTSYDIGVIARNVENIQTSTTTGSGSTQSGSGGGGYSPPPTIPEPQQIDLQPEEATCDPQIQSCPGTPPSAPSFFFSINGGKKSTKSVTTTLTVNDTFPDQFMISTSSLFAGAQYQSPVATLPFTLSSGDGIKTLYLKFKKTVDGVVYSFTSSTSITLDTEPPSAPIIGVAESGIENGKIVGQPQFSGVAEPGVTIRIRYENLTGGTASRLYSSSYTPFLLVAGSRHVTVGAPFPDLMFLAGVIGDYYATADENGQWELSFPLVTTPGNYVISVASIDDAGNVSTVAPQVSFTVPQDVIISGCTDTSASNFNPNATEDDGSCIQNIPGCTDSSAYNFNATANIDNGSCVPVVLGCRDRSATNYNPQANTSNNSCQYAPEIPDIQEPLANTDDASQTTPDILEPSDTTDSTAEQTTSQNDNGGSGSSDSLMSDTNTTTLRVALTATLKSTQQSIQSFVSSTRSAVVEAISVPIAYVTERIPESVKHVAKQVQKVADDPQVEEANEYVVAPAVAVASTANIAVGFQLPQLILFLRYLFTQPILLLRRKKQKQWGTIFNVYTKQPIDLATIRVIDAKTGNIVRTQVTDQKGRYFIIVPAGSYRVEIQKTGFTQESEMLQKQHTDIVFDRLYVVGSVVYVSEKRTELNVNIPLEPLTQEKPTKEIIRVYTRQATQYMISTIGLYVSVLSYLVSPTRFVGMLVLLHVVFLYGFHVLSKKIKRKGAIGVVRDALRRHTLGRVVVRVYDATYNKLVETLVTDHKGRYGALVGPSIYYVTYDKSGYEKKKSPTLDFSLKHAKDLGGIIARDEVLHPISSEQPTFSPPVVLESHHDTESFSDPTRTLVQDGDISSDAGDTLRDIAQYGKGKDS